MKRKVSTCAIKLDHASNMKYILKGKRITKNQRNNRRGTKGSGITRKQRSANASGKRRKTAPTNNLDIEAELNMIRGLTRGPDYLEVLCGCTSKRLGDAVGKLKILADGQFLINCECTEYCSERNLKPYDFVKHSKEGPVNWTRHIWVQKEGEKVPIYKTILMDFFKIGANEEADSRRGKRTFHRDEFIRCSNCQKERRLHLRTKEDCRVYHDALISGEWKCGDQPHEKITCDEEEERESRKRYRGCPLGSRCEGCSSCVCLGCVKCRFVDCSCQVCVDYIQNVGQP